MPRSDDEPLRIDGRLLIETQARINTVFQADLNFPVYVIPAEKPNPDCIMAVSGGASSLYYRSMITGWQGAGFVIQVHRTEMLRTKFHGAILHEIAHCFQAGMATPWSCLPEEMGFPAFQTGHLRPAFPSAYQTFLAHRPDFWRLCCHVWDRGVGDFLCRLSDLCTTWVRPDDMLSTLAPEIERLRNDPLWKIAMRSVPREFETIFDFDPNDWDKFECPSTSNPQEKNVYVS